MKTLISAVVLGGMLISGCGVQPHRVANLTQPSCPQPNGDGNAEFYNDRMLEMYNKKAKAFIDLFKYDTKMIQHTGGFITSPIDDCTEVSTAPYSQDVFRTRANFKHIKAVNEMMDAEILRRYNLGLPLILID